MLASSIPIPRTYSVLDMPRRDDGVARRDDADRSHDVFQRHVLDQETAGAGPQRAVDRIVVVEGGEY